VAQLDLFNPHPCLPPRGKENKPEISFKAKNVKELGWFKSFSPLVETGKGVKI
jgi:hypothetical protein